MSEPELESYYDTDPQAIKRAMETVKDKVERLIEVASGLNLSIVGLLNALIDKKLVPAPRYLIFAGEFYYPIGIDDLLMSTDDYERDFINLLKEREDGSKIPTLKAEAVTKVTNKDWLTNRNHSHWEEGKDIEFDFYEIYDCLEKRCVVDSIKREKE